MIAVLRAAAILTSGVFCLLLFGGCMAASESTPTCNRQDQEEAAQEPEKQVDARLSMFVDRLSSDSASVRRKAMTAIIETRAPVSGYLFERLLRANMQVPVHDRVRTLLRACIASRPRESLKQLAELAHAQVLHLDVPDVSLVLAGIDETAVATLAEIMEVGEGSPDRRDASECIQSIMAWHEGDAFADKWGERFLHRLMDGRPILSSVEFVRAVGCIARHSQDHWLAFRLFEDIASSTTFSVEDRACAIDMVGPLQGIIGLERMRVWVGASDDEGIREACARALGAANDRWLLPYPNGALALVGNGVREVTLLALGDGNTAKRFIIALNSYARASDAENGDDVMALGHP